MSTLSRCVGAVEEILDVRCTEVGFDHISFHKREWLEIIAGELGGCTLEFTLGYHSIQGR